jgi:uncharacterized membrane protein SirB2
MLGLKFLHVTTVIASFILFSIRAYSVFGQGELHRTRFFRLAPHINDTVLLTSALGLAYVLRQYPFVEPWLTVKVVLLLVYILLGMAFMKLAKTGAQKTVLFVSALACYLFIVTVAVTRQPLGILSHYLN